MNPIMRFFECDGQPMNVRHVADPIGRLAQMMHDMIPDGPEKSAGLRKLLEARDCFVRAYTVAPKD